jgi:hypothetical protein
MGCGRYCLYFGGRLVSHGFIFYSQNAWRPPRGAGERGGGGGGGGKTENEERGALVLTVAGEESKRGGKGKERERG